MRGETFLSDQFQFSSLNLTFKTGRTGGELRLALSWKVIVLEINSITGKRMHMVRLAPGRKMMSRMFIGVFAYGSTLQSPVFTPMLQTETTAVRAQKIKQRSFATCTHVETGQLKATLTRYYKGP